MDFEDSSLLYTKDVDDVFEFFKEEARKSEKSNLEFSVISTHDPVEIFKTNKHPDSDDDEHDQQNEQNEQLPEPRTMLHYCVDPAIDFTCLLELKWSLGSDRNFDLSPMDEIRFYSTHQQINNNNNNNNNDNATNSQQNFIKIPTVGAVLEPVLSITLQSVVTDSSVFRSDMRMPSVGCSSSSFSSNTTTSYSNNINNNILLRKNNNNNNSDLYKVGNTTRKGQVRIRVPLSVLASSFCVCIYSTELKTRIVTSYIDDNLTVPPSPSFDKSPFSSSSAATKTKTTTTSKVEDEKQNQKQQWNIRSLIQNSNNTAGACYVRCRDGLPGAIRRLDVDVVLNVRNLFGFSGLNTPLGGSTANSNSATSQATAVVLPPRPLEDILAYRQIIERGVVVIQKLAEPSIDYDTGLMMTTASSSSAQILLAPLSRAIPLAHDSAPTDALLDPHNIEHGTVHLTFSVPLPLWILNKINATSENKNKNKKEIDMASDDIFDVRVLLPHYFPLESAAENHSKFRDRTDLFYGGESVVTYQRCVLRSDPIRIHPTKMTKSFFPRQNNNNNMFEKSLSGLTPVQERNVGYEMKRVMTLDEMEREQEVSRKLKNKKKTGGLKFYSYSTSEEELNKNTNSNDNNDNGNSNRYSRKSTKFINSFTPSHLRNVAPLPYFCDEIEEDNFDPKKSKKDKQQQQQHQRQHKIQIRGGFSAPGQLVSVVFDLDEKLLQQAVYNNNKKKNTSNDATTSGNNDETTADSASKEFQLSCQTHDFLLPNALDRIEFFSYGRSEKFHLDTARESLEGTIGFQMFSGCLRLPSPSGEGRYDVAYRSYDSGVHAPVVRAQTRPPFFVRTPTAHLRIMPRSEVETRLFPWLYSSSTGEYTKWSDEAKSQLLDWKTREEYDIQIGENPLTRRPDSAASASVVVTAAASCESSSRISSPTPQIFTTTNNNENNNNINSATAVHQPPPVKPLLEVGLWAEITIPFDIASKDDTLILVDSLSQELVCLIKPAETDKTFAAAVEQADFERSKYVDDQFSSVRLKEDNIVAACRLDGKEIRPLRGGAGVYLQYYSARLGSRLNRVGPFDLDDPQWALQLRTPTPAQLPAYSLPSLILDSFSEVPMECPLTFRLGLPQEHRIRKFDTTSSQTQNQQQRRSPSSSHHDNDNYNNANGSVIIYEDENEEQEQQEQEQEQQDSIPTTRPTSATPKFPHPAASASGEEFAAPLQQESHSQLITMFAASPQIPISSPGPNAIVAANNGKLESQQTVVNQNNTSVENSSRPPSSSRPNSAAAIANSNNYNNTNDNDNDTEQNNNNNYYSAVRSPIPQILPTRPSSAAIVPTPRRQQQQQQNKSQQQEQNSRPSSSSATEGRSTTDLSSPTPTFQQQQLQQDREENNDSPVSTNRIKRSISPQQQLHQQQDAGFYSENIRSSSSSRNNNSRRRTTTTKPATVAPLSSQQGWDLLDQLVITVHRLNNNSSDDKNDNSVSNPVFALPASGETDDWCSLFPGLPGPAFVRPVPVASSVLRNARHLRLEFPPLRRPGNYVVRASLLVPTHFDPDPFRPQNSASDHAGHLLRGNFILRVICESSFVVTPESMIRKLTAAKHQAVSTYLQEAMKKELPVFPFGILPPTSPVPLSICTDLRRGENKAKVIHSSLAASSLMMMGGESSSSSFSASQKTPMSSSAIYQQLEQLENEEQMEMEQKQQQKKQKQKQQQNLKNTSSSSNFSISRPVSASVSSYRPGSVESIDQESPLFVRDEGKNKQSRPVSAISNFSAVSSTSASAAVSVLPTSVSRKRAIAKSPNLISFSGMPFDEEDEITKKVFSEEQEQQDQEQDQQRDDEEEEEQVINNNTNSSSAAAAAAASTTPFVPKRPQTANNNNRSSLRNSNNVNTSTNTPITHLVVSRPSSALFNSKMNSSVSPDTQLTSLYSRASMFEPPITTLIPFKQGVVHGFLTGPKKLTTSDCIVVTLHIADRNSYKASKNDVVVIVDDEWQVVVTHRLLMDGSTRKPDDYQLVTVSLAPAPEPGNYYAVFFSVALSAGVLACGPIVVESPSSSSGNPTDAQPAPVLVDADKSVSVLAEQALRSYFAKSLADPLPPQLYERMSALRKQAESDTVQNEKLMKIEIEATGGVDGRLFISEEENLQQQRQQQQFSNNNTNNSNKLSSIPQLNNIPNDPFIADSLKTCKLCDRTHSIPKTSAMRCLLVGCNYNNNNSSSSGKSGCGIRDVELLEIALKTAWGDGVSTLDIRSLKDAGNLTHNNSTSSNSNSSNNIPTTFNIRKQFLSLIQDANYGDSILFYFSGFGAILQGRACSDLLRQVLIPSDCDWGHRLIDMKEVDSFARRAAAKVGPTGSVNIVLDCGFERGVFDEMDMIAANNEGGGNATRNIRHPLHSVEEDSPERMMMRMKKEKFVTLEDIQLSNNNQNDNNNTLTPRPPQSYSSSSSSNKQQQQKESAGSLLAKRQISWNSSSSSSTTPSMIRRGGDASGLPVSAAAFREARERLMQERAAEAERRVQEAQDEITSFNDQHQHQGRGNFVLYFDKSNNNNNNMKQHHHQPQLHSIYQPSDSILQPTGGRVEIDSPSRTHAATMRQRALAHIPLGARWKSLASPAVVHLRAGLCDYTSMARRYNARENLELPCARFRVGGTVSLNQEISSFATNSECETAPIAVYFAGRRAVWQRPVAFPGQWLDGPASDGCDESCSVFQTALSDAMQLWRMSVLRHPTADNSCVGDPPSGLNAKELAVWEAATMLAQPDRLRDFDSIARPPTWAELHKVIRRKIWGSPFRSQKPQLFLSNPLMCEDSCGMFPPRAVYATTTVSK